MELAENGNSSQTMSVPCQATKLCWCSPPFWYRYKKWEGDHVNCYVHFIKTTATS